MESLYQTPKLRRLIRSTYKSAGLDPKDTQYFEAHGTGTAAGDPFETRAIGAVFSEGRDEPLIVGSIKSNIGHLEGASGLAGIIKTIVAIENAQILPNMLFNNPNPRIGFTGWKLKVPTEMLEWKTNGTPRRASVNSFGYGGTNAHVILEEYRQSAQLKDVKSISDNKTIQNGAQNGVHSRPFILPLTSHSPKAGELSEKTLASYIKKTEPRIANLAYSLTTYRSMHQHRSFVIASSIKDALEKLEKPRPLAPWSHVKTMNKPRPGFIFTGQGAQWFAIGRQLIQECPLFRQTVERCDAILKTLPDAPS